MAKLPLAVQLYTLRELCNRDFARAALDVAAAGYRAVETAGYGNLQSAAEARKALDDAGLRTAGMHVDIERVEAGMQAVLDDADALGTRLVIVPWLAEARRTSAEHYRAVARTLTEAAAAAKRHGIEIAYHHHEFEYDRRFDGRTPMEILFETVTSDVKFELDVYWLAHAGVDPVAEIRKFGPRVAAVHLKDMSPGSERRFAPVGTGTLDFPAIVDVATRAGASYAAVEQDDCYGDDPLQAIRTSYENLARIGLT
jgi:sugar phosphate isomerase/epimerase